MEKTIKHYTLLREIGKGGMGIIYKALDTFNQRHVALKILPMNLVNRSTVTRFNREAQAMSRLKHPNMVEVYDFGMDAGQHYFAMELVEGASIKTTIKYHGAFSVEKTLDIIAKVCDALSYINSEGLIHRDIKSDNIMLSETGDVKVMDFGLVKIPGITNVTMEGSAIGTAEYIAPEQIDDGEVDARADIFSLGVTMYEMLTGVLPFTADTLQGVFLKVRSQEPQDIREINPEISKDVWAIVQKAMKKDVSLRYQRASDVISDINVLTGNSFGVTTIINPEDKKIEESENRFEEKKRKSKEKRDKRIAFIGIIFVFLISILSVKIYVDANRRKQVRIAEERKIALKNRLEQADKHYLLGLTYFGQGKSQEAIYEYEKAIDLRSNYGQYYWELALLYEKIGEKEKAKKEFSRLLKNDPKSIYAVEAKKKIGQN